MFPPAAAPALRAHSAAAWSARSFFSPRCGTRSVTLCPARVASASASRTWSSTSCDRSIVRGHRLVVVELRQERSPAPRRLDRRVGLGEIGAVAPVLAGAEEEHLDAVLSAFLMDREDVRFLDRLRVDALMALDMRQCGEAVAIDRCTLEIERSATPPAWRPRFQPSPSGCVRRGNPSPPIPARHSPRHRSRRCRGPSSA
jgi:hypothetical protein